MTSTDTLPTLLTLDEVATHLAVPETVARAEMRRAGLLLTLGPKGKKRFYRVAVTDFRTYLDGLRPTPPHKTPAELRPRPRRKPGM